MSRSVAIQLLVFFVPLICCHFDLIQRTVVEGISRNVAILCDLDRALHPVYWNISNLVYELYSVPDVFTAITHEAITLGEVDRRMNGWKLQCFTLSNNVEEEIVASRITVLSVVITSENNQIAENDALEFTQKGRLAIHYQDLEVRPEGVNVSWLYFSNPNSPCGSYDFDVDVYSQNDIHSNTQPNLEPIHSIPTTQKSVLLEPNLMEHQMYFQVINNCARSNYFNSLVFNGTEMNISATGSSATFEIPSNLRNTRSVQLIWSKNDNTQCVCPPVEHLILHCACNIENPVNVISITNNRIMISNLIEGKNLKIVLVSSVSTGCLGTCNLRSVEEICRVIITHGNSQTPTVNQTVNQTSPSDEQNTCEAYIQRAKIHIIIALLHTHSVVTLQCNYSEHRDPNFSVPIIIYRNNTAIQAITLTCNSSVEVDELTKATTYYVRAKFNNFMCTLHEFQAKESTVMSDDSTTSLVKIFGPSIAIAITLLVIFYLSALIPTIYLIILESREKNKKKHN